MSANSIEDALVQKLQDIYEDPSNDEKVERVKKTIETHFDLTGKVVVSRDDLERWVARIREADQFKKDCEQDIGYVVDLFKSLEQTFSGNPLKMITKMATGKLDVAELGLDLKRLEAIGHKYAPLTMSKHLTAKK